MYLKKKIKCGRANLQLSRYVDKKYRFTNMIKGHVGYPFHKRQLILVIVSLLIHMF